ncbi:hypothetical protein WBG78_30555 [Chryseolinea sp. T2]|uniref:hypothetical protein n=1 Tax=Chryseolinea sp. T2 TaxID=3129255 RepID=UPI003076EE78
MSLAIQILNEGISKKEKFKYALNDVRAADGSLNFDDDKMDCSEFFLSCVKSVSSELYTKLTEKLANGKVGGNTKTIQKGIIVIEGIDNISNLPNSEPKVGDWLIWSGHIEMIEKVTPEKRVITLGANGKEGGLVPKNIDSKSLESAKNIAANFIGIWTPRLNSTSLT